jgi:hypothetical protein
MDTEHLEAFIATCDYTDSESLSKCEIFDCMITMENVYRSNHCPDSEPLFCEKNAFEGDVTCEWCENAYDCD